MSIFNMPVPPLLVSKQQTFLFIWLVLPLQIKLHIISFISLYINRNYSHFNFVPTQRESNTFLIIRVFTPISLISTFPNMDATFHLFFNNWFPYIIILNVISMMHTQCLNISCYPIHFCKCWSPFSSRANAYTFGSTKIYFFTQNLFHKVIKHQMIFSTNLHLYLLFVCHQQTCTT